LIYSYLCFFVFIQNRDGYLHVEKLGLWEGVIDEDSFNSILDKAFSLQFFSWNLTYNGSLAGEKTSVSISWIDPNDADKPEKELKISQLGNTFQPLIDLEVFMDSFQQKVIWQMDAEQSVRIINE
jgi:hypothetical protein